MTDSDGEGTQETNHEGPFKSSKEKSILSVKLILGFQSDFKQEVTYSGSHFRKLTMAAKGRIMCGKSEGPERGSEGLVHGRGSDNGGERYSGINTGQV